MNSLTPQEIAEVIADARVAHLAVIADGEPYVTPMSFVSLGDGIAFRSLAGKRLDALRANPRVSIAITQHIPETGAWRSVIATGTARVVEDTKQESIIIEKLLSRYSESFRTLLGDSAPTLSRAYVIRVEFDSITGRSSGAFLQARTRPGRL
jgi:nitroimidazol reductase NimA-like FMN-containing flavoprotein (pyridoxamine 5'-phosphate oxidase superfamily)